MKKLSFISQYVFKPRTVGAVLPSSKYLAAKMVQGIDFAAAKCIVEYGAGTGVFTEKILQFRMLDTTVIIFEMNEAFISTLQKRFGHQPNVHIFNESAANVGQRLLDYGHDKADYIVSGLPFASLPLDVSANILEQTKAYLKPGGYFVTFQYTLLKMDFFHRYFENITTTRELRNMPPAYVLKCM